MPKGRSAAGDGAIRAEIIASTGKSMLVEAAAGTGKTTLIVDRIVRGVRDGALRMPTTVAITFTEKAAGELEARIRECLTEALHGGDLSPEEERRLRAAMEEMDRANISTIHAFCARLLREKAAEAGVDPEFAVLEPAAAQVLKERCWREWMARQVAECPEPLMEALRAGAGVDELKRLVFALAEAPELLEQGRFQLAVPSEAPQVIAAAVRGLAIEAERAFGRHMRGGGNDHSRKLRRLVRGMAGASDLAAVRRFAYAAAGVPVDQALTSFRKEAREQAREVLSKLERASAALGAHLSAAVFAWAAGFVAYYSEAKLSRSVLDFQDLLLLAARVLREQPAVRHYFRRRFEAFFVDELQDTDPLQAEAIAYLCEQPGGAGTRMEEVRLSEGRLFAVGDPKQSIYRFRRADVQVYDRFKGLFGPEAFGEERTRQISCNFRSVPRLLEWFNRLFEVLFERPATPGVYQAPHVALEHAPDMPRPAGPAVVALCPEPAIKTEDWKAESARRYEAHHIACAIRKAVDGELPLCERPLSYRDFALLFRALGDVDVYEAALERYGIPYRVVGGKHFYRREQIAETMALLQAVDDPLNEAAIVGALRSSFFGISDEELFRYHEGGGPWNYLLSQSEDGPVAEAMRMLAEWHRRRNRVPPHVLLREVFDVTKAPQAFLLKPAGPQRVANLDKMLGDLRALGVAAGNFGAVVRHLSAVREAELPEEESGVLEPGDDFVQIMSMHKAKGLQFEAVVLPDLARGFPLRSMVGPLVYNRLDGQVGVSVAPGVRSANYGELREREHQNQLAELRRLFYVACTRAKRLLVLALHWAGKQRKESFQQLLERTGCFATAGDVPFGGEQDGVHYLDTRGWHEEMDVAPGPRGRAQDESEDVAGLLKEREAWQESHRLLVQRASEGEPFVVPSGMMGEFRPARLGEESAGWRTGAAGKDFGSLFHNLMMRVPLEREPDGEAEALIRNLAAVEAAALGVAGAEDAAGLALAALRNAQFRALIDGAERVLKEVGFCVPLGRLPVCSADAPGFLEGSIDLLVLRGRRATVLDYKTDACGRRDLRAAEARYWPQLAFYALAARACGQGGEEAELVLFFVRPGLISRRRLDDELTAALGEHLAKALAEARA